MVVKVKFMTLTFLLLLLSGVSSYTEFEIEVPTKDQVGVYGETVVLPCSFPLGNNWELSSSVITWQRGLEVIHSFYHSQDQLDRQSSRYSKRTSLYHKEIGRGNASLRLERATLEDAGLYTCSVSTQLGSQKKTFRLKIAAFYPEPRLYISLLSNGQVDLLVTSQGGYPTPSLQWLMGDTEDVTSATHLQLKQDEHTKLYNVNSKLNLTRGINSSITFILKNEDLGQEIKRNINLFSENGRTEENGPLTGDKVLYVSLGVVSLIVISSLFLFICILRQKKTKFNDARNDIRKEKQEMLPNQDTA